MRYGSLQDPTQIIGYIRGLGGLSIITKTMIRGNLIVLRHLEVILLQQKCTPCVVQYAAPAKTIEMIQTSPTRYIDICKAPFF